MRKWMRFRISLIGLVGLLLMMVSRFFYHPIYKTWDDVEILVYLRFVVEFVCFALIYLSALDLIFFNSKYKFVRILSMIAATFGLVGVGMMIFGTIPAAATIPSPSESSIESVTQFLEDYKIVQIGSDLILNGLIVILLTKVLWGLLIGIHNSLIDKPKDPVQSVSKE